MLTGAQATTGGRQPRRDKETSGPVRLTRQDAWHGKHVMKPCGGVRRMFHSTHLHCLHAQLRMAGDELDSTLCMVETIRPS